MIEIAWGTLLLLAGGAFVSGMVAMLVIVLLWARH
jgi:hypothetical protein